MEQAIKEFAKQFAFKPQIENSGALPQTESFVLGGMGGSHLAAGLLKMADPSLDLYIHRDYGLPSLSEVKYARGLFIASSFSGNTEETIDFAKQAHERGFTVAVITRGGDLLQFAKKNNLPYVQLPDVDIQPRSALGLSLIALVSLIHATKGGYEDMLAHLHALNGTLQVEVMEKHGEELATKLANTVPIIYSARAALALAYNWKIKFNETGKIPAFYNVFPELNHNEMNGFDAVESTRALSAGFHFVFIKNTTDAERIQVRMNMMKKMLEDRGFGVTLIEFGGGSFWESVFNNLLLADWTALALSRNYGTEAEKVPMIEEFKKLIA